PLTDASDLFREVSPEQFRDLMLGSHFVAGVPKPTKTDFALRHSSSLTPPALSAEKQEALQLSFEDFLASLAELNAQLVDGRYFHNNHAFIIDATSEASVLAIAPQGTLALECDEFVASVKAEAVFLLPQEPWKRSENLGAIAASSRVEIDLSSLGALEDSELRRTISITIQTQSKSIFNRVKLVSATPRNAAVAK
ncbi:MAG: hypothetical protein WCJ21_03125, partial [Planctomycetota bacterium]